MIRWRDAEQALDLGVHDLLQDSPGFGAVAMSGRARRAAGVELHRELQRASSLQAELRLRHVELVHGWTCTVHGRVDGIGEEEGHTVVEEIKSSALDAEGLDAVSGFGAWERQLRLYLCFVEVAGWPAPVGRLRVVSLVDGSERILVMRPDPDTRPALRAWLEERIHLRERWLAWLGRRRASPVRFAHPDFRPSQRELAELVERSVLQERQLLVQAPTGLGKTAAVAWGAIRAAWATDRRIFWATARTPQQWEIERTLRAMAPTTLRAVTLRAQGKACDGCAPETCPLADRPFELDSIEEIGVLDADAVTAHARRLGRCPWRLGRVLAEHFADLVIGDLNYAFDPDVHLRFLDAGWIVVVDEAHQLPDRAMAWGSPKLEAAEARAAAEAYAAHPPFVVVAEAVAAEIDEAELRAEGAITEPSLARWRDLRDRIDELALDHAAMARREEDPWLELARAVEHFVSALERAGEETVALWSPGELRLCCRDPARVLGPRFAAFSASIQLSATLSPDWFHRDRCGLDPARTDSRVFASPFPPENRLVLAVRGVSTAYAHRARDREKLLALLESAAAAVPGNVGLYFGSFEQLIDLFGALELPGRERLWQRAEMPEAERAAVLDALRAGGAPKALAAVLGGAFGEGVDLPAGALQAAIVVGPALPPPSVERSLLQQWLEDRFDEGFDLAFIHPGMTRVVQAAGRVVRGPEERGAVVLVCQRFARRQYARWLPEDWEVRATAKPAGLLEDFFAEGPDPHRGGGPGGRR